MPRLQTEWRWLSCLDGLLQDTRYAIRAFRRSPGFTLIAIATLALGIGVNATVFTLTNAALFKGFSLVERNDRILYISSRGYGCCVSYPDFEDWRAQAQSFEDMGVVHGIGITLSDGNDFPESYAATEISADTFRLIGQRPILGRDFVSSDERPGATPVTILSYRLWERRYGKNPDIIGQTVRINSVPTTVIGVMPQGLSFPQNQVLWLPLVPTPDVRKREVRNLWFAFGRMADGVTIESARAEMAAIGARLATAYPNTNEANPPVVQRFHEFFIGRNAAMVYGSMWGAVGFVLLIACANLANLMLARAIGRSREMSVRMALGAGRWRVIRQLLIECVILSAIGGSLGWWISKWGVRTYELADRQWRVLDYTMDATTFLYIAAISIGTGLLFGLVPALRLSKLDVNTALKDGGRSATTGGRGKRVSAVLVVGEMALAVVLLAGAGVMIRSFLNLYTADVGVKTANVLAMLVDLPSATYTQTDAQLSFFDRLTSRLQPIAGVESLALANRLPAARALSVPYELAGAPPVDEQRRPRTSALIISPRYFQTLGARIVSGRDFNESDGVSGVPVVIVNQRFASQEWPGEDALGKRLRIFDGATPGAWLTVVGVSSNIAQNGVMGHELDPLVYVPYRETPSPSMWILIGARVPPAALATQFRREVQAIDPDLPIGNLWTLDEWLQWPYREQGNFTTLFLTFAVIALVLASVGLYAVIAHSVSQRTQEIGLRMAVGASARDILKSVFMQGMVPLGIGLAIGLLVSFSLNRVLQTELVEVSSTDPITYVVVSAVLIASALIGCLIPARRAMRVDPLVALRHE